MTNLSSDHLLGPVDYVVWSAAGRVQGAFKIEPVSVLILLAITIAAFIYVL